MFAANPFIETWFANTGWAQETESNLTYDEETQVATLAIAVDKNAQWQAQVKYQGPVAKADKFYDLTIKMKANHAVNGITVKYQDNAEMTIKSDISLSAGEELVYQVKDVEGVDGGNGIMVFDFGYSKAGDTILIYGIEFKEKEERTEPVDPNPYEAWFGDANWSPETDSKLEYDEATQKATVTIAHDKDGQWKAQVKYKGPKCKADKFYDLSLKMKANKAVPGITLKYQDNAQMVYEDQAIALQENVEFAYSKTDMQGMTGNGILVLDFGHATAGTVIEIYEVLIVEKDNVEGIEDVKAGVKAQKVIENGQLIILKNGIRYNVAGQEVH